MDIDANLDVLWAALETPPGHHRQADADMPPSGDAGIFQMQDEFSRKPGRASIDRLEAASLVKHGEQPAGTDVEIDARRRLVSAGEMIGEAVTEAVADQTRHPVSTVGRITASFDGRIRYCSATVVADRVALTAAHCVFSRSADLTGGNGFADWVLFQPQYKAGTAKGNWAGERVYILNGWKQPATGSSAGTHDFAFVRLDAPIAHLTGTAGLLANTRPEGPFTSLGYPHKPRAGFEFDGRFLFATTGERIEDGAPHTTKARNGLTEGSSGGPWFMLANGELLVAGINSTKPMDGDDHTWSPRFANGFQKLLARVLADMTGA